MLFLLTLFVTTAFAGDCPWAGVSSPDIQTQPGRVIVEGVEYPVGSPAEITAFQGILRDCDASEAIRPLNAWRRSAELTKSGLIWFYWMLPITIPAQQIQRAIFRTKLTQLTREDDSVAAVE